MFVNAHMALGMADPTSVELEKAERLAKGSKRFSIWWSLKSVAMQASIRYFKSKPNPFKDGHTFDDSDPLGAVYRGDVWVKAWQELDVAFKSMTDDFRLSVNEWEQSVWQQLAKHDAPWRAMDKIGQLRLAVQKAHELL